MQALAHARPPEELRHLQASHQTVGSHVDAVMAVDGSLNAGAVGLVRIDEAAVNKEANERREPAGVRHENVLALARR